LIYFAKIYTLTISMFFAIDMLWLGVVAKAFYRDRLGYLMVDKFNWVAAILFYLVFIGGILLFCVYPALERQSIWRAIVLGALFGMVTYATYDMTNLATIKNWPVSVTIVVTVRQTPSCG